MAEPHADYPRCRATMEMRVAAPRPGARVIRADVCDGCGGHWFDEYELAEVNDALGGVPFRMAEIGALGRVHPAAPACPRCGDRCAELMVLDVTIDVCRRCRGVWLDGGEYEALARAAALEASRRAETTGSYRLAPRAAKAIRHGVFACPRCEEDRPTADGLCTPRGLVCGPCFHAHEEADLLADASRDHGATTARMKQGALPGASPAEPAVGAAGVLGALAVVAAFGSGHRASQG
jgi:Zn-finger nucleic acid-binding protein